MGFSFGKPAGLPGSEFFLVHRSFIKHVCFNINPLRELHQSVYTLEECSFVRQAVLAHCVSRGNLSNAKKGILRWTEWDWSPFWIKICEFSEILYTIPSFVSFLQNKITQPINRTRVRYWAATILPKRRITVPKCPLTHVLHKEHSLIWAHHTCFPVKSNRTRVQNPPKQVLEDPPHF